MQKYSDVVLSQGSNYLSPVANASVKVLVAQTNALATIYSDNGITVTANPLTTLADGSFYFYAANGRYTLQISYLSYSVTKPDVVLEDDPTNGQTQVITGGSIDNTPIGATTPSTGSFTNLSVSGTVSGVAGRLINIQTFLTTATYTPTAGTNAVIVEVQAPGGGGGGSAATGASQSSAGGGGGAGAYARVQLTSGFSGVTVTVPAGGAGGTAGANNGTAGSAASFGAVISCPGGAAGIGGTATSSAVIISPSGPTASPTISSGKTLDSIAGESAPAGYVITPGVAASPGKGATSPKGSGGVRGGISGAGNTGSGFGAGGSGALTVAGSSAANAGANGSPGIVVIYEFS